MSKQEKMLAMIKEKDIKFIDLRFTDTKGKERRISIPASQVDIDFCKNGKMFDGSSIHGWKGINASDMLLQPDIDTMVLDPFTKDITLNIRCNILEPETMQEYQRDPRSIAKRAETYLRDTNIADKAFFGPELEFFLFDDVRFHTHMSGSFYQVDDKEAAWNSSASYDEGNMGHRPAIKGGYCPVAPVDSSQEIRNAMSVTMEQMGLTSEVHHHEVATAGQNEITCRFNTLVNKADEVQVYKYVVHNVAHSYGKTATFMPKPLVGDNGTGMHVHQSLNKNGSNIFTGDKYGGLSETALYYIGGIIKHAQAINAFTNASTNSYKRLVPGFEAPVTLAYSSCNRSAAIRIPFVQPTKRDQRIEVRFPDPSANPYLAFTALLMAGIDGIKHKIDPGQPIDKNLYDLPKEEAKNIPKVSRSLAESLQALDSTRDFLTIANVMSDDFIDSYIQLKQADISLIDAATHPLEFDLYYSV